MRTCNCKKMIRFSILNQTVHSLATKVEQTTHHRFESLICDSNGRVITSTGKSPQDHECSLFEVSAISGSIFTEYTDVENLIDEGLRYIRICTDRHVIFTFRIGAQSDPRRCVLLIVFPLIQQVTCIDEFTAIANSIYDRLQKDVTPLLGAC